MIYILCVSPWLVCIAHLALQSVFVRGRADAAVDRPGRCFPPRSRKLRKRCRRVRALYLRRQTEVEYYYLEEIRCNVSVCPRERFR